MGESKTVSTPTGAHFKLSSVKDDDECVDVYKFLNSSIVGSIMYAMMGTKPDVANVIGLVCKSMSKIGSMDWEAVKWLLRYWK